MQKSHIATLPIGIGFSVSLLLNFLAPAAFHAQKVYAPEALPWVLLMAIVFFIHAVVIVNRPNRHSFGLYCWIIIYLTLVIVMSSELKDLAPLPSDYGQAVGWISVYTGTIGLLFLYIHIMNMASASLVTLLFGVQFIAMVLTVFSLGRFPALLEQNPTHEPSSVQSNPPQAAITPLLESILTGNPDEVKACLSAGTNINAPYPANGNTPLHIAAWNGYTDIVKLLLAQPGIDKNAKNHAGKTPLELAREKGFSEIEQLLADPPRA